MPIENAAADPGSFRDPAGVVIRADGRVFRAVAPAAWAELEAFRMTGLLDRMIGEERIIGTWVPPQSDMPDALLDVADLDVDRTLEHEVVPFISYPYEWPFSLLKRAALHHLELQIDLLASGFTLSDASAYNIQFRGTRPVFIDVLSIRRYEEGAYWAGYRQFCEQFLNPLLLAAKTGVPYHAWLRGSMEGIAVEDLARLLPARAKLSWRALLHVVLHAGMTTRGRRSSEAASDLIDRRPKRMSRPAFDSMLVSLRDWIAGLELRGRDSVWADYADNTSYEVEEVEAKRDFVRTYVRKRQPAVLLDLGCNSGDYSEVALGAAAGVRVIGFDADHGALEAATARADRKRLDFLPLYLDVLNPSPDQGWAQRERSGFMERAQSDGLLALALLHHIVIGRNIPLSQAVEWLCALAPSGVIEFVPKQDPMVQRMLRHRDDIFAGYDAEAFCRELGHYARVVNERVVSATGRILFEYERH